MLRMVRRSSLFDAEWYRRKAGLAPETDAASHYFHGGWRQADPSPWFRQESYLAFHEDVRAAEVCPLAHYLFYNRGKDCPGVMEGGYRKGRLQALERALQEKQQRKIIQENRAGRFLVSVRLCDPRGAEELAEYLKNLRPYTWTLAVALPEGAELESPRAFWKEALAGAIRLSPDVSVKALPEGALPGVGRVFVPEGYDLSRCDGVLALRLPARRGGRKGTEAELKGLLGAGQVLANLRRLRQWRGHGIPLLRAWNPEIIPLQTGERPAVPRKIAFAVSEPVEGAKAGDCFTARELAEAMERRGWKTTFLPRNGGDRPWNEVDGETGAVLSLLEDYDPGLIRGAGNSLVTVGWARNWFGKWMEQPAVTGDDDLLLATGGAICREMAERLHRPVTVFPIATNPERFFPAEPTEAEWVKYGCDYCFAGNRFTIAREVENALAPEKLPWIFHLYGGGWEHHPKLGPYARGRVDYEEMPALYRCTKMVVDDATPSTREVGSVNSRVFDALAAGCLVVTNNETGSRETFEGLLPVYRDEAELTALLRKYLEDEEARRERVAALREMVLAKHTYDRRAELLEKLITEGGIARAPRT